MYEDGELYIFGGGMMEEWGSYNDDEIPWYDYRKQIKSVVIADGVTSIGGYAFSGCTNLTAIMIPDNVTSIGNYAFNNCDNLTEIVIPDSVTTLGEYAFYYCDGLLHVTLGSGLTTIAHRTFYFCKNLTSVAFGNGLISIGREAFNGCGKLTEIILPDSVTSIGYDAFYRCAGLTKVTLSSQLTSIGDYTFYNSRGPTEVVIPAGVTAIGNAAFAKDYDEYDIPYSFKSVEFLGNAPTVEANAFPSKNSGEFVIYYHAGTTGWTPPTWNGYYTACLEDEFSEFSALDENNRNVQNLLFSLNDESMTATVGDDTNKNNNAGYFGNNNGVVTIPATVTKDGKTYRVIGINQYAFSGNNFLETLEIGANLTSIDPTAFLNTKRFTGRIYGGGGQYLLQRRGRNSLR